MTAPPLSKRHSRALRRTLKKIALCSERQLQITDVREVDEEEGGREGGGKERRLRWQFESNENAFTY